ncbi:hypothetical protein CDL12_21481 [Handroanthus impetiginosus]|uniref:Late embryogenesis abundant protein LEA-2 subgroup domain-containing protein n=1 Tax=Handroanthus impetiginosus TaxID=429701 RepID=A0A2G9GKZ0_9LAMI|nr:hypothetical protein CDL12_21481 [Handroanthus impetiginosus]
MSGSAPKGNRTPLQKSLSRRVSFNEATISKAHDRRTPPLADDDSDTESRSRRRGCGPRCNSCCAWTSLILGILLLLLLLVGGIYFAFLQSNLPEVHLHRLDIYTIDVVNTNNDTLLTADFEVRINATNGSDRIELGFRSMTASMSSAGIDFGDVKIGDLHQLPRMSTDMKIRAAVKNASVEEAAAKELQDNVKERMLVINVVIKGHIDFFLGGKKMNGFPFKIDCSQMDQSVIDNGNSPKCNAKMSPLQ